MPETIQAMDAGALLWIQEQVRCPALNPLIELYTNLGEGGLLWIAVSLALLLRRKTRRAGCLALVALLGCYAVNDLLLKELFARPRPFLTVDGLEILIAPPNSWSFPSGHASSSLAAAGTWLRTLPGRGRWVLLALAVGMALSRLYVGVHYPTDVLAGMLVGLLGSWALYRFTGPAYDRLSRRWSWLAA